MQHTAVYHRILLQQMKGSYGVASIQFPSFPFNLWCFEASSFKQSFKDKVCGKSKSYVNKAHVTWTHINLPDLVRSPSGFPRFSFTVQGKARSPEQHFLPCHTLSCSMYLKTMSLASTRKRRLGPPRQADSMKRAFSQRLHLACFLLFFLHVLHFWIL